MKKAKIIHFIYNLGRGGAETMMVRVIKDIDDYEHVIVTLFSLNKFGEELQCDKLICLNLHSLIDLPFAIYKFRKIIKQQRPDIVHTHLFWPTFIARAAVPKKYPLITTIHAFIASSVEYKHWYICFLDKLSYHFRKSIIVVVAKGALEEYFSFLKLKPYKSYVLYTFVDLKRFNMSKMKPRDPSPIFRVITIGALRLQKNQLFLINSFSKLKNYHIELHIYGVGDLEQQLQKRIDETGARVVLKGEALNLEQIIPAYDLYVMASSFEGFSLSVLEAMAMGMPLLLSDIPSFREQCEGIAEFFSIDDDYDFIQKLVKLSKTGNDTLKNLGEKGRLRVSDNFTLTQHITGLKKIYEETLAGIS